MMKSELISERGQALVIMAIAMIGLVAITGLAIDGSMVLADRRHAQNAADTAALAGALTYARECEATGCVNAEDLSNAKAAMEIATLDRTGSNGYRGDLIRSEIEIHTCEEADASCSAPYAGNREYLQVIITSRLNTFFAHIIGIPTITNRVQAVAMAKPTTMPVSGYTIVALNKTAHNAMKSTGSGGIFANGGGIFVNSNASGDALAVTGNGVITADPGYSISVVGGYSDKKNLINPTPATSVSQIDDPLASLSPPANPGGSCQSINYSDKADLTLNPGCYNGIKNSGKGNIILNQGLYYLNSGDFSTSGSGGIYGNEVLIYVKSGSVSLTGQGDFNITPPTSGTYAGMSLFVDRDNAKNVSVTGNGSSYLAGTIYAAGSLVTVTGNGDSTVMDSQILADKVAVTGSGDIVVNNTPNNFHFPGSIALAH